MVPTIEPTSAAEVIARIRQIKAKMLETEETAKLEFSKEAARRLRAQADRAAAKIEQARAERRAQEEAAKQAEEGQIMAALRAQCQERRAEVPLFSIWLLDRCRELGVDHRMILSRRSQKVMGKVRHQLYREASEAFPNLSYPALGKRFNRNHSSIHYAIHGKPGRAKS